MSTYVDQGHGENAKPHLLIAKLDTHYGGVHWTIQCPYEGNRPCGLIEECFGTPQENERWGCPPMPIEPQMPKGYDPYGNHAMPSHFLAQTMDEYMGALDDWRDAHTRTAQGTYGHHTAACWYPTVLGDDEPEYYLADMPEGLEIRSPIKVCVGYDSSLDEATPIFRLWKEAADGDPS